MLAYNATWSLKMVSIIAVLLLNPDVLLYLNTDQDQTV